MTAFDYREAFSRNIGFLSEAEQEKLRSCRVAIGGMGGVGGIHALNLARMGVEKFTIADPDEFELANFNRQAGATHSSLGKNKAVHMEKLIKDINPVAQVTVMPEYITEKNVDQFLKEADLYIDGLDIFEIKARRTIFGAAQKKGIYSITAGPVGFGTAWMIFDPEKISFDDYFNFNDSQTYEELMAGFMIGLLPSAIHANYQHSFSLNLHDRKTSSSSAGCHLAAGVVGAEAIQILLRKDNLRCAPYVHQFDVYAKVFKSRKIVGGNRNPISLIRRWFLTNYFLSKAGKIKQNRFLNQLLLRLTNKLIGPSKK